MHCPASNMRSAFYQVYEQADYGRSCKTEAGMGTCRNAKIAKPKFFINEIKVIMETFTLVKFQERFSGCFVVPGFVSITAFHRGENMDQTFCAPCIRNNFLNTVVFAESMEFPDEFNFNPVLLRNFFSILTDLFCKGLGKTGVIKNPDTIEFHIGGHSFSMAPVWDISLDDHAVITGNDTINLIGVFISKQHDGPPFSLE